MQCRNGGVMTHFKNLQPHLLTAIIRTAKEECAHSTWDELEPLLAEAWEDLRGADTPSWDVVADEIQKASLSDVSDKPH